MLVRISNTPRDYAWGSTTLIADLEGREPPGSPEAEVWFGDHPGSPAAVHDGTGRTLDEWLPAEGPAVGASPRLPYLLKLLAAGAPLSIQVHPSKAQAEGGFAREERNGPARDAAHRNYRDDNHKPELIVALSERFEALAGLRDLDATHRLLASLDSRPGVQHLRERLEAHEDAADSLRELIGWLLAPESASAVAEVIAALPDPSETAAHEFEAEFAVARRLREAYPADPGVVVALLMNLVILRRGEAIFVPAGALHAYVSGLGVELMAASDNVLRGGLTPKHIDVPELLTLLDTRPAEPPRLHPVTVGHGVDLFDPGVPDFALAATSASSGRVSVPLSGTSLVLSVADGTVVQGRSGKRRTLDAGQAVLATADEGPLAIAGDAFVAMPGVS